MLKIKVYDEYLQLFNDELAVNEDKAFSNALKNIRELVGYHLDTNNFWITWKEQEKIVYRRLNALANNELIGAEKSWFGLFSNYDFMHISPAVKLVFDDILVVLRLASSTIVNSALSVYTRLLSSNPPNIENKQELMQTAFANLENVYDIILKITASLEVYMEERNHFSKYDKDFCFSNLDFRYLLRNIRFKFVETPNLKSITLYNSSGLEVLINSSLKLEFIFKSAENNNLNRKFLINLQDYQGSVGFLNYLFSNSINAQRLKVLNSVLDSESISDRFRTEYSGLRDSARLFQQDCEFDKVIMDIINELIPETILPLDYNGEIIDLFTKKTFLLHWLIELLRYKMNYNYNKHNEFWQFILYLDLPNKVALTVPEINFLVKLIRGGYQVTDVSAKGKCHPLTG